MDGGFNSNIRIYLLGTSFELPKHAFSGPAKPDAEN